MDKKHQKCLQDGDFPAFVPPKTDLKIGLCHFCTLIVPQIHDRDYRKLINGLLADLRANRLTEGPTDRGDYIGPK